MSRERSRKSSSASRTSRCASETTPASMHWPCASGPTACLSTAGRVAPVTVTTNAWCGTRKAIASRSRRKNENTLVVARASVAGCGAGGGTAERLTLGPGLARSHGQFETLDTLVVAGQRRRQGESHETARGYRGGGHRRRGDHSYLWSEGRRRSLRRLPLVEVDGDARPHDA